MNVILRRVQGLVLLFAMSLLSATGALAQATVVVAFDYYQEPLIHALPIMKARGLPATFYVVPSLIDHPSGTLPTSQQLADASQAGWEIGIYSNSNMVTMLGTLSGTPPMATPANALATHQFMAGQKTALEAKGFAARSYAANQRSWNARLADLSRDLFDNVRVADLTTPQSLPVTDPNWVKYGGSASLSGADTAASLCAQLSSVIAAGNVAWFVVGHKVGPVGDPFTIASAEFAGFSDCLVTAQNAGQIKVLTFSQAVTPP